jgi:hypothetical protein
MWPGRKWVTAATTTAYVLYASGAISGLIRDRLATSERHPGTSFLITLTENASDEKPPVVTVVARR